jgi:hypothetical protein
LPLSEGELLALTASEWRHYEEAAFRKEAKRYAWECTLHGLRKSNRQPYTSADFLPRPKRKKTPAQIMAEFKAAFPKPPKTCSK